MVVTQTTQMIPCTPVTLRPATIAWMTAVMARQCSIQKCWDQQLIDRLLVDNDSDNIVDTNARTAGTARICHTSKISQSHT